MFTDLRRLTGRRLPAVPTAGFVARGSGRAMDGLQRVIRVRLPFGYQGPWIVTRCTGGTDDTKACEDLGVEPPPLDQTLGDTVRWMVEAEHLPPKLAGKAWSN